MRTTYFPSGSLEAGNGYGLIGRGPSVIQIGVTRVSEVESREMAYGRSTFSTIPMARESGSVGGMLRRLCLYRVRPTTAIPDAGGAVIGKGSCLITSNSTVKALSREQKIEGRYGRI